jgi:hypothetical protein
MEESGRLPKQISTSEEKEIRLPPPHTAEGIVISLIRDNFTAKIISVKEMANGEEVYRVILRKKIER